MITIRGKKRELLDGKYSEYSVVIWKWCVSCEMDRFDRVLMEEMVFIRMLEENKRAGLYTFFSN